MDSNHKCNHKQPRAQASIEFALILPILLLLVLGAMDFGRVINTKLILTNAAREGSNFISRHPEDKGNPSGAYAETKLVVHEEADSSGITISGGEITITNCCTENLAVSVTVTKTANLIYESFLQKVGIINGPVTLTSTVSMRVQ